MVLHFGRRRRQLVGKCSPCGRGWQLGTAAANNSLKISSKTSNIAQCCGNLLWRQSSNELFGQRFEHAIRVPYGNVARLIKEEADLPTIEEALRRYFYNYRA
jgi:hypothetical protein